MNAFLLLAWVPIVARNEFKFKTFKPRKGLFVVL